MHADSLKRHIDHLESSHQTLDRKIKAMEESYGGNDTIHEMKKKKLYLKDEIEKCRHQLEKMLK